MSDIFHASNHALQGHDDPLSSSPSPAGLGMLQAPHHIYLQRPHSHSPHPPPLFSTHPPPTMYPLHDTRNLRGVAPAYPPLLPPSSSPQPPTTITLPREIPTPIVLPSTSKPTISSPTSTATSSDGIDSDASAWTAKAMQEHPELLEFIERVRPLNKAASFGRLQETQKTATRQPPDDIAGHSILTQLILQHLHSSSMKASCKILEEESRVKYVDYQLSTSRLLSLMHLAVKDPGQVWMNLSVPATENINIWDEPLGSNLVFGEYDNFDDEEIDTRPDKVVVAASLNQLVISLTSDKLCDLEFFKTFMWTYQSFTSPEKFLQKLVERYHVPQKEKKEEEAQQKDTKPNENKQNQSNQTKQIKSEQNQNKAGQNKRDQKEEVQMRVGKVLMAWIQDHWEDFSQSLVKALKSFIDNDLRLDGNVALVKSLSIAINSKLRPAETSKETEEILRPSKDSTTIPKGIYSASMDMLDVDEEELARQLTLIHFSLLSSIKAPEFLNQAWNKPKLKQRSPNILRTLQHSSEISAWVSNSILKIERVKDRARAMAKFIRVVEHLVHTLKNFNGAMAVMAGLQAPAVDRLKHTKEELPASVLASYNELQALLSPSASYKKYRSILSRAVPPCVPFLEAFLADLTSIEDSNPDYIHGGLINFGKSRLIFRIIAQIQAYQNAPYNLQSIYQIACHLCSPLQGVTTTEEMQYQISVLREPRHDDNIM